MSIPSPALVPPTLTEYQLSYGGLTFGGIESGLPYQLEEAPEGLYDTAEITTGDQKRPLDQGEFPGIDTWGGRNVILKCSVQTDGISFDHARQALTGVMKVRGSEEKPLWFRLPSGLYAVMARPRKSNIPGPNVEAVFGKFTIATLAFHCTDPRVYSAPSLEPSTELPTTPSGMTFNATAPFTFGGATEGGLINCQNFGDEEVRPVIVFEGPLKHPHISNTSISGNPTLEFAIELKEGDRLIVDTDYQTALLITKGTTEGASARTKLVRGSTWFGLEPGNNGLQFGSLDVGKTGGKVYVQYASGWDAV